MTTADWALLISLLSATVSFAGFVWNVWSKFIYPKPKVRVSYSFSSVISNGQVETDVISLAATNMGPAEVTLHSSLIRGRRRLLRKPDYPYGLLKPLDHATSTNTSGVFSGGLPKKLAVGEQFSVYFIAKFADLAGDGYDRIGFTDTFGRHHWAAVKQTKDTRLRIRNAMAAAASVPG